MNTVAFDNFNCSSVSAQWVMIEEDEGEEAVYNDDVYVQT